MNMRDLRMQNMTAAKHVRITARTFGEAEVRVARTFSLHQTWTEGRHRLTRLWHHKFFQRGVGYNAAFISTAIILYTSLKAPCNLTFRSIAILEDAAVRRTVCELDMAYLCDGEK
ncbi:unnamed protein product [Enterobius vermicularis]|uniref:HTH_48 domain-containing protein n=1 Tax=Enterobius vermicularis TaxID=51028 RepID=A0A0N4VB61_ENTVE|nr:unnamed protein product [Enterobius vermicularis]